MSGSSASATVVAKLVETMRTLAGPHPGFRPVHAKGIVCSGAFRASAGARATSRAPHLQGQAVPTVVRFSNSSGDPDVHDGIPNARALAVKFQLPGGKNADILGFTSKGFPRGRLTSFSRSCARNSSTRLPASPVPDAVPRFLETHRATRAFIERLTLKPVPASYGQASYYSEHCFKFTAADGTSRFGRYRWNPEAGEAHLAPDDASKRSANFLREELEGRLRNGPVAFHLLLQVAGDSDPTDDPTALWPADRPLVELGHLEVTRISPTGAADERRLVFDPTNVTDAIDLSGDPILLARSAAYSISYDHRSKER